MSIQKYVMAAVTGVSALFISMSSGAQIVSTTEYMKQANVRVYVTPYKRDADVVVYKTPYVNNSYGNKGMWFFTKNASEANKRIFYIKHKEEADVKVYFTTNSEEAGWQNKKKMYLFK